MPRKAALEGRGSSCVRAAEAVPWQSVVARGDTRIMSLVSHQMMHSGENRSAVGHVSACSGLCSSCSSVLPWQEVQQEKQLLSKGC